MSNTFFKTPNTELKSTKEHRGEPSRFVIMKTEVRAT